MMRSTGTYTAALVENIYRRIAAAVGADAPGAALQGQRRRRDGCAALGQSQRRRVRCLLPHFITDAERSVCHLVTAAAVCGALGVMVFVQESHI
ncbi:MAG: hypothetical protein NZ699_17420 [Roseiflexus sp.]|nr:hypothetical protein [Roseiflexus sp.]MCS7290904.1 hypothetical protein [Roseiflexus sp.]MDW8146268.1 hypothetical protein [Roseiflexaceae bacterium]